MRCIAATDTHLVAAGDDGNALVYEFSDLATSITSAESAADGARVGAKPSGKRRGSVNRNQPQPEWQS